ncbi:MAG: hypothetical protein AAFX95_20030 [Cyanobacteria bacterium J06639_16]
MGSPIDLPRSGQSDGRYIKRLVRLSSGTDQGEEDFSILECATWELRQTVSSGLNHIRFEPLSRGAGLRLL